MHKVERYGKTYRTCEDIMLKSLNHYKNSFQKNTMHLPTFRWVENIHRLIQVKGINLKVLLGNVSICLHSTFLNKVFNYNSLCTFRVKTKYKSTAVANQPHIRIWVIYLCNSNTFVLSKRTELN